ncbi:hypothetical protein DL93DRAFT_1983170 [Clavulina sp. PMI_390]|nr:hypothetical protein DL93DRAFT_1983170 [Clavulina sp. PMI_390]
MLSMLLPTIYHSLSSLILTSIYMLCSAPLLESMSQVCEFHHHQVFAVSFPRAIPPSAIVAFLFLFLFLYLLEIPHVLLPNS